MIDGQTITLGGRTFVAPPAPLSCIRKYYDVFAGSNAPTLPIMADVVFAALKRNYPDLTQDECEEKYVDVGNLREAFKAVMLVSGAQETKPGEAEPGSA